MWFIIDDQMADDRRIRRLPLATVGLWVKLCVIHSKGVSMQSKDPSAYPGHFDQLDLKDAGGTMRQLQQLMVGQRIRAHLTVAFLCPLPMPVVQSHCVHLPPRFFE